MLVAVKYSKAISISSCMETIEDIIARARSAKTKHSWEAIAEKFKQTIATETNPRLSSELYRLLSADSQRHFYGSSIWELILQSALSSWNLDLGQKIVADLPRIQSASLAIVSSRVMLEAGHPSRARDISKKATRLLGLLPSEKLKLEMLACSSYVQENKRSAALRILRQIETELERAFLQNKDRADLAVDIARTHFFLGRYPMAAKAFQNAYLAYLDERDWENAAKAVFNTAACYHNAGNKSFERSFPLVEECRKLAERYNLAGPLSHCEAFYGTAKFHQGNLADAREHFRKALEFLPPSDRSFRRLHILSMLTMTYLRNGKFPMAKRFGAQTLELAERDESARFRSRYDHLNGELAWEDGRTEESQNILESSLPIFEERGVTTLEELSNYSRYILQSAWLGKAINPDKIRIEDILKKHLSTWLEFLNARGQYELSIGKSALALEIFDVKMIPIAKQAGDQFHLSLALLGRTESHLALNSPLEVILKSHREFEVVTALMVDTPMKTTGKIVNAAIAYRQGRIEDCVQILDSVSRMSTATFVDRFCLDAWRSTLHGKSARLTQPWHFHLLGYRTKNYFSPSVEWLDDRHFLVSKKFPVSLENHATLAELLVYLFNKPSFECSIEELQENVWKQSINQLGWQQKIRNTMTRVRDHFTMTMAPILIQGDKVKVFSTAIKVYRRLEKTEPETEILRLITEGQALSSMQLANRLNMSPATTKRILKRLSEHKRIQIVKKGRQIVYEPLIIETP